MWSRFWANPGAILIYGTVVTTVPMVAQILMMVLSSAHGEFSGLDWAFYLLCIPSIFWGLVLGVIALCSWRIRASRRGSRGAYLRAAAVGVLVGALGAFPVGRLQAATTLATHSGIDESVSVLVSGAYLALMFAGYMLCWEWSAARAARSLSRESL